MTKAFTNLLVMQAIEQGRFLMTTPISDLIPEFKGQGREKVRIWHLLSHQAGFPIIFEVKPGWYIDNFAEISATVVEHVAPIDAPCDKVSYSPLVNHVLMATALLRTDPKKRGYRQIVQEDILDPLQMNAKILAAVDPKTEPFKLARALLTGEDMFGMEFITAHREGRLGGE